MRVPPPARFLLAALLLLSPAPVPAGGLDDAERLYFGGQPERALEKYRSLYNADPSIEAAMNAATVAEELGHHREAAALLDKARAARLGGPGLLIQLGWARLNLGQFDVARAMFREALEGEPNDPIGRLGLAVADRDAGRLEPARERLAALAADRPEMSIVHFYLGETLEMAGDMAGAVISYENAIKNDSHFLEARPRLATLFEKLKRSDDAWRQYVRMSYADPTNWQAEAGMSRLASRITKKPQEIIPPRRLENPRPIPPVLNAASLPVIRVGIGSTPVGAPSRKKTVTFRTSQKFTIADTKSGAELLKGAPREPWSIQLHESGADIIDSQGQIRATFKDKIRITQADRTVSTIILNTLTFAPGTAWGGMTDKEFRGVIEISADLKEKTFVIVNVLSVEEYLYGVLAAEMPVAWPLEALKAQAVMARNVALYRSQVLKLHKKYAFDLCDEQHCQVYNGVSVESEKVRTAVDATRGRVLSYDGQLCHTVFSSNCGGVTQSGPAVGWADVPYWNSVGDARAEVKTPKSPWHWKRWVQQRPDLYCKQSQYVWNPEYRWARVVPAETIASKLAKKKKLGRVKQVYIQKRARSGFVQRVRIVGTKGEIILAREDQIRHYLGLGSLRSNLFTVQTVVRDNRAERFIFWGSGWGHGVGFCQSGAAGRAEDGASYQEILAAYFPKTVLK